MGLDFSFFQLFGCGSVAQTVLSRNTLGEPLTVHIGFSVGLMMAAYVAGGVSGKHNHTATSAELPCDRSWFYM